MTSLERVLLYLEQFGWAYEISPVDYATSITPSKLAKFQTKPSKAPEVIISVGSARLVRAYALTISHTDLDFTSAATTYFLCGPDTNISRSAVIIENGATYSYADLATFLHFARHFSPRIISAVPLVASPPPFLDFYTPDWLDKANELACAATASLCTKLGLPFALPRLGTPRAPDTY